MRQYIVDSSVIVGLILAQSPYPREKLKEAEIHSVSFLSFEVANAFRFQLKNKSDGKLAFTKFLKLPISFHSLDLRQMTSVLDLAYTLNTTVYDTCYHFLAMELGMVFLTGDRQYFEKAKKLGSIELVS